MKTYTIADIVTSNRANGFHWFDHDTMQSFGTHIPGIVFTGPGGVYFLQRDKAGYDTDATEWNVCRFYPESSKENRIGSVEQVDREGKPYNRLRAKTKDEAILVAERLAGEGAVSTKTPFKPFSPLDDFLRDMRAENPETTKADCVKLMAYATRHHAACEHQCNGTGGDMSRRRAEKSIGDICERLGFVPVFQGDPRGATVKLQLPSGKTNDWGNEGYCVPKND